jgi:hypothetical protein
MHVILSFTLSAMPWVIAQQSYLELSRRRKQGQALRFGRSRNAFIAV